jgi:hypothetical protein
MMATIADAGAIGRGFTQKMDGCQRRINPIHGSEGRFDPVCLH